MSARQFIKVYLDVDSSPEARLVAAYVEYRCHGKSGAKPREIVESEFAAALRKSRSATRRAISEALAAGLIQRTTSKRGDGRGVFVYRVTDQYMTGLDSVGLVSRNETADVSDPDTTCLGSKHDRSRIDTTPVSNRYNSDAQQEQVEHLVEPEEEQVEAACPPAREFMSHRPMTESQSPANMAKHAGHSAQIVASHAAKHGTPPTREPVAPKSPLDLLGDGVWRALANHSVTGMLAMNTSSQWSRAFCEVAGAYQLTAAEVTALIDRWEAERASLLDQVAAEKAGTFPALRALWFSNGAANAKNREWITDRIASIRRADAPPRERWADKVARENRENRERYQALRAEVPS